MTTETLIKRLRSFLPPGPLALEIMMEAAARLESLQWELTQAIAERTPHDYGILKEEAAFLRKERDEALAEVKRVKAECANQQLNTRPEPSRLEIAAMLLAAMCGSQYTWTNAEGIALRKADTLIAAAKEAK